MFFKEINYNLINNKKKNGLMCGRHFHVDFTLQLIRHIFFSLFYMQKKKKKNAVDGSSSQVPLW